MDATKKVDAHPGLDGVERISVSDLRDDLQRYLGNVTFANKSYVLVKHGKPVAILSPLGDGSQDSSLGDDDISAFAPVADGADAG